MQNEELKPVDYNAPLINELANLPAENAPVTPNNPPWNSPAAFGVWIFSVAAILILPVIFILPYFAINKPASIESLQTDTTAIFLNLISILPAHLFTLLLAWLVATRNKKFSLHETLGFESGGFRWWYYLLFLIGFFALAALVNYFIPEGDNELLRILRSSRTAVFVVAFLATFTAPLVEEVVYRGILYSALQRSVGIGGAVAIVTILFALVHVPQYWGSPGTILLICLLSLGLTLIRVKTDNLLPCVIMHTIFNGIQAIVLILGLYVPQLGQNTQETTAFIVGFFI